ncbi:MAG: hypothetical protein EXS63_02575 [Candidatus Omnitrophica bacterium]|nr:hypothetical protein [Candidatus Omnitrophota bacterium]
MSDKKQSLRWRLGEILIQNGWITWENLEKGLAMQREMEKRAKNFTSTDYEMQKSPVQILNLGEILVRHGWMNWEQLQVSLEIQKKTGQILGEICIAEGFVLPKDMYRALAIQANMAFIDFKKVQVGEDVLGLVPKKFAYDHRMMPVIKKNKSMLIAISNPRDILCESELQKMIPDTKIHTGIAAPEDIDHALKNYYGGI